MDRSEYTEIFANVMRNWCPYLVAQKFRRLVRRGASITFDGPFTSWQEAEQRSSGYDDSVILEKVLAASLKVKRGESVFERDSVLFDKVQYVWPVTAGLLWAAARESGRLSVLDFGGSLGSSYFQNHKFLGGLQSVRWSVVEQAHFVESGCEYIQDERLVFYPTIARCVAVEKPNVVLLSSVLQYLPNPYTVLDELVYSGAEVILVDRTSFHDGENDRVAIQNVGEAIYRASYPLWIFSKSSFMNYLSGSFELVTEWLSPEGFVGFASGRFSFNGLILQRKRYES
jgi:putative methyltransferase (TIGR04325 family)